MNTNEIEEVKNKEKKTEKKSILSHLRSPAASKRPFRFHIGMRSVKTALAATLCAVIYLLFLKDRNPTFACIGAIFGTGSDMEDSWLNGGNRLFGTVIGGFLGMLLFHIYINLRPEGGISLLMMLFLFIGVIILILACQFFKWPGGIQPGGVVLCIILFNTPVDTYITYSLDRMLDTAIGVIIALLINLALPRGVLVKALEKLGLRKKTTEN